MRFFQHSIYAIPALVFLVLAFLMSWAGTGMAAGNDSIRMGTVTCPGASFDCKTLSEQKTEIISASNNCIARNFGISEPIMGVYNTHGEFENCATSSRRANLENGAEVWAACCLKKTGGESGQCALRCTRYMAEGGKR